jgi:hypothetical protein
MSQSMPSILSAFLGPESSVWVFDPEVQRFEQQTTKV